MDTLPDANTRWRCGGCGNKTRFDVVRESRVAEFWHVDLAGEPVVEQSRSPVGAARLGDLSVVRAVRRDRADRTLGWRLAGMSALVSGNSVGPRLTSWFAGRPWLAPGLLFLLLMAFYLSTVVPDAKAVNDTLGNSVAAWRIAPYRAPVVRRCHLPQPSGVLVAGPGGARPCRHPTHSRADSAGRAVLLVQLVRHQPRSAPFREASPPPLLPLWPWCCSTCPCAGTWAA